MIKLLFIKKHIALIALCLITLFAKGDTNFQQRLATLKSAIPLTYNDASQYYIDWYINNPDSTAKIMAMWKIYSPIMDRVLKENNQPIELKYLALALSNMNTNMVNKSASGLWQMLFDDAKSKYKMKINSMVDERRDIEKSTRAVALYFKDLMLLYNDWYLAITAFRATPNSVNKAIINSGANLNYWSIYPFLNYDNREVVPRFVAAAYIANFYGFHQISPSTPKFEYEFDTVKVEQQASFSSISSMMNIPIDQLLFLNPEYKTEIVPYAINNYILRLPKGKLEEFQQKKYNIYNYAPMKPDNQSPSVNKKDTAVANQPKMSKVSYVVKSGENLLIISDYFDCPVSMTKYWNGIRSKSNYLKPGRILYFYVKEENKDVYARINKMTPAQKKKLLRKD